MSNSLSVDGKVALITGGSRGLGYFAAEVLLANGASRVYISSRSQDACDKAAEQLNKATASIGKKGKAIGIGGNFTKSEDIDKVIGAIASDPSSGAKLDIVIANAGNTWGAPFGEHPLEAFDRVYSLNVKGVFGTIQAAAPLLERAGTQDDPARVLIMGSISGIMTGAFGNGGTYGYSTSKAAVHHLSKLLAVELGFRNITVNTIASGFINTKLSKALIDAVGEEKLAEGIPRGRIGSPDDLKSLVLYLCSKGSSYINGAVIPLDGGQHLLNKL
ncbi:hypothetical protein V1511DRAFT_512041 [Dipodascopsis uninucleata]